MKKYNEFVNEKFFAATETKADEIFKEMIKDFEDNGKDLRKVMVIGDYKVHYVCGKYHQINNSPMTGNKQVGSRDISVMMFAPEHLLDAGKGRIEIEEKAINPKHDPSYGHLDKDDELSDDDKRDKWRIYNPTEERFDIPYKKAKKIFDYFNNEWDKQYPQLKGAKYKNLMNIQEIESGDKPRLGSVDVRDKNNQEIIYSYHDFEDEEKLKKYIKNHVCIQGKSREDYPVTYFTKDGESEADAKRFIKNTPKERIERVNLERVHEYSK